MRFGYTHAHFTDPIGTFEHSNYDMEDALVALIAGANTNIRLLSYSLPTWNRDWFLFDPIEAAINRGVQLEVYGQQHSNVERLVSRHRASNQIRGWCWNQERGDLFHIKGIVVDNVRVYIGSANLSQNGIKHSAEWGIVTESPDLCIELERYINHLIENRKLQEV